MNVSRCVYYLLDIKLHSLHCNLKTLLPAAPKVIRLPTVTLLACAEFNCSQAPPFGNRPLHVQ